MQLSRCCGRSSCFRRRRVSHSCSLRICPWQRCYSSLPTCLGLPAVPGSDFAYSCCIQLRVLFVSARFSSSAMSHGPSLEEPSLGSSTPPVLPPTPEPQPAPEPPHVVDFQTDRIVYSDGSIRCRVCDRPFGGPTQYADHVIGKTHKNNKLKERGRHGRPARCRESYFPRSPSESQAGQFTSRCRSSISMEL